MPPTPFKRRPPRRTMAAKVLIGCEGARTEPLYFDGIRKHLRASMLEFVLVEPAGSDPLTIVDAVVDRLNSERRQRAWQAGDSAWAVFDGEEHWTTNGKKRNWNTAVQRAASNGIEVAVSNPCFELWYLLHFEEQTAWIDRAAAVRALKQHGRVPDYEKNLPMFERLHGGAEPRTLLALDRAQRLKESCTSTGWDRWRNPSTGVYRLAAKLLAASLQTAAPVAGGDR